MKYFATCVLALVAACGRTGYEGLASPIENDQSLDGGDDGPRPDDDDESPGVFSGFGAPVDLGYEEGITSGSASTGTYYGTGTVSVGEFQIDALVARYDVAANSWQQLDYYSGGADQRCIITSDVKPFKGELYYIQYCYDRTVGPATLLRSTNGSDSSWTTRYTLPWTIPAHLFVFDDAIYLMGSSTMRSTDGTTFAPLTGVDDYLSHILRYNGTLIAQGYIFDSSNGDSTWIEYTSIDGVSWTRAGTWFHSTVDQWSRALTSYTIPGVAGRFITGTISYENYSRGLRTIHLIDGAPTEAIVDDLPTTDGAIDPSPELLHHPSGYTLLFVNERRGTQQIARIRGTRDGQTWVDLLPEETGIQTIGGQMLLGDGSIAATVLEADQTWHFARLPVTYRR